MAATTKGPLVDSPLGQYVTLFLEDAPEGVACVATRGSSTSVTLAPVHPGELPAAATPGAAVRCSSVAGEWTTVVLAADGREVELALPRWAARAARRRHPRVRADTAATLVVAGRPWAARLEDVSVGGAAALVERACGLEVGALVPVELEHGKATASVRSVRVGDHPLLVVLGLEWRELDPGVRTFVGERVARGLARPRRSAGADR